MGTHANTWTRPNEIRAQVQKMWDRGDLLRAILALDGELHFPKRLVCRGPAAGDLGPHCAEVQDWLAALKKSEGRYRIVWKIVWKNVQNRIVGAASLPAELWLDSLEDALALIGKIPAAAQFAEISALIREREPELILWLSAHPLKALELAPDWPRLLDILAWLRTHPRPGISLRQLDLPAYTPSFWRRIWPFWPSSWMRYCRKMPWIHAFLARTAFAPAMAFWTSRAGCVSACWIRR